MKNVLVLGVAALALVGCGSKEDVAAAPAVQCSENQDLVLEDNGAERVEKCVDKAPAEAAPAVEAPAADAAAPEAAPAEVAK
jgi:uncharacterized protein YcfL